MISQKPSRLVLILTATVLLSGCTVSRQQTRFHKTTSDGQCNCYTCQNNISGSPSDYSPPVNSSQNFAEATSTVQSQTRPTYAFPADEAASFTTDDPAPVEAAPLVSSEPFETLKPELETFESFKVNEVRPALEELKQNNPVEPSIESGGALKSLDADDVRIETVQPPKFIKPVESPQKIELPAPASSFESGNTFKPRKRADLAPLDTSWLMPKSLQKPEVDSESTETAKTNLKLESPEVTQAAGIEEKTELANKAPANNFSAKDQVDSFRLNGDSAPEDSAPPENPEARIAQKREPLVLVSRPTEDPASTFFEVEGAQAKPLPKPEADGKIVLKANPVERNVVYCPPSRSVSKVVVPSLRTHFKNSSQSNWLRSMPQVADDRPDGSTEPYQTTAAAKIVQPEPNALPEPVEVASVNEPKSIPVRLRAIPMNERMIKGQQIEVRFREQAAAPQPIRSPQSPQMSAPFETEAKSLPVQPAAPAIEQIASPEQKLPELQLEPVNSHTTSAIEHTAHATASEGTATPPWRN